MPVFVISIDVLGIDNICSGTKLQDTWSDIWAILLK